nr:L-rhamnose mutarotase [Lewinella sp. IMCC34191]
MMTRKAFKMTVYADRIDEYKKRHDPIWPELAETLKRHGVSNYAIFLDATTNTLFGYAEIASEEQWTAIAETEICQRWWTSMKELMETNPDDSPVSVDLEQVFHLD